MWACLPSYRVYHESRCWANEIGAFFLCGDYLGFAALCHAVPHSPNLTPKADRPILGRGWRWVRASIPYRRGSLPKWRNGIRGGLKNHWGLPRVGSNPTFGTLGAILLFMLSRALPSDGKALFICPGAIRFKGEKARLARFHARRMTYASRNQSGDAACRS